MKTFHQLAVAMGVALVTLLLSACSGSASKYLDMVPANTDLVAVIDGEAILESAGGSVKDGKIVFPKYLDDILSSYDMEQLEQMAGAGCIDLSSIVVAGNYNGEPMTFFGLKDPEAFVKFIRNEFDYEKETSRDDMTAYYKGQYCKSFIVVNGDMAIMFSTCKDDVNPVRAVARQLDKAKSSSFAKTDAGKRLAGHTAAVVARIPAEFFDQSEFRGIDIPRTVRKGSFFAYGDLRKDELAIRAEFLGEDGNPIGLADVVPQAKKIKLSDINTKALRYITSDEIFVAAASYKDIPWSDIFESVGKNLGSGERMVLAAVEPYVSNIDGTVAIGVGPTKGLKSLEGINGYSYDPSQLWSATIVVEFAKGKAKSTIRQLKELADGFKLPVKTSGNGFSLTVGEGVKVYAEVEGNFLIIANHEISSGNKNMTVSEIPFGRNFSGIGVALNKESELMRDLGLGDYSLSASVLVGDAKGCDALFRLEGGESSGLFERAARACIKASDELGQMK